MAINLTLTPAYLRTENDLTKLRAMVASDWNIWLETLVRGVPGVDVGPVGRFGVSVRVANDQARAALDAALSTSGWAAEDIPPPKNANSSLCETLKRARDADPGWQKAMKEWVADESRLGKDDPAEGTVYDIPDAPKP
jgi:hypothetical protein